MTDLTTLADELSQVQSVMDNSETVSETALSLFQSSLSMFRSRIDAFVNVRKKFEEDIETMEKTIKFAREKKKDFEEYLEVWDKRATEPMSKHPDVQFSSNEYELTILESSGIVIEDEKKIPSEFLIATTVYRPDKAKIREAIKRGVEVPGAILERRKNLKVMGRV